MEGSANEAPQRDTNKLQSDVKTTTIEKKLQKLMQCGCKVRDNVITKR